MLGTRVGHWFSYSHHLETPLSQLSDDVLVLAITETILNTSNNYSQVYH
jgi:hypothetical protein